MMHGNVAGALALRALCVCGVQRMHSGGGLQLQLRDGRIDHREALLCEHRATREPQPIDLTLFASGPRAGLPDSRGQSVESPRALGAQEMQLLVLVGTPDLVTQLATPRTQGSRAAWRWRRHRGARCARAQARRRAPPELRAGTALGPPRPLGARGPASPSPSATPPPVRAVA